MEQNFSGVESKQGALSIGGQQLIIFQMTWTEVGAANFLRAWPKLEKTGQMALTELWLNQNGPSEDSSVGVLN